MRPKKRDEKGTGELFRARLDRIINMRHELVRLAEEIDWDWIDEQVADCFSAEGRPGTETRFLISGSRLERWSMQEARKCLWQTKLPVKPPKVAITHGREFSALISSGVRIGRTVSWPLRNPLSNSEYWPRNAASGGSSLAVCQSAVHRPILTPAGIYVRSILHLGHVAKPL